jgi:tetratricopeptide (TPR) repeat protein
MAEEWLIGGEVETAVSEALAVVEADSTHARARLILGHALLLQGEPLAAAEHLEKLLGQNPLPYLVVRDLGFIYAELGEEESAISHLEEAIRIYPADPEPYRKLADIHRRGGRTAEAASTLVTATAVAKAPYKDLIAHADLGRENRLPEVETVALEKSLAFHPFERDRVERLARLYREAGDAAQAVRTYEVLCLLAPDDVEAHRALVELALAHGPRETARRYAERLGELDPGSELARRALVRP